MLKTVEAAHEDNQDVTVFIISMLSFQECCRNVVQTLIDKRLASPTTRQLPVAASTMQYILAVFEKGCLSDSQKKQATFVHMI
jgi:hypothetical protein